MTSSSFDDLVSSSVSESISRILGADTWRAINFYFDIGTVARDPERFTGVLDRMFGSTSKVLQKMISDTLLRKVGAGEPRSNAQGFLGILRLAKAKFSSPRVPR